MKVLIVDDEPGLRRLISAGLTVRGYEAIEASNGQEALVAISEGRPDVVLLDMAMPVMTGCEMLAILRRRPDFERYVILIMTALADQETRAEVMHLGASVILDKPFPLDELDEAIRSALGRAGRTATVPHPSTL